LPEPKDGMRLITLQARRKNNWNIDSKAPTVQKRRFLVQIKRKNLGKEVLKYD
jgi:hypothetical protein